MATLFDECVVLLGFWVVKAGFLDYLGFSNVPLKNHVNPQSGIHIIKF